MDVVTEVLELEPEELYNKLVWVGSDGASVNVGQHSGIATRLRLQYAPYMANIHCMSHCLQVRPNCPGIYRRLDVNVCVWLSASHC